MKTYIKQLLDKAIKSLQTSNDLPKDACLTIQIDRTRNKQHGDFSSNIALILAKLAQQKPHDIANKIVAALPQSEKISKVEIAGPGFINFFVSDSALSSVIVDILAAGRTYGESDKGDKQRVIVEFVSSNPTGPLHVGHGRSAAYGACIADLLTAMGFAVQREYYVNDAGRQMDILTTSIWLRYLELFGEHVPFPSNGYKGDYIVDIAKALKVEQGDSSLHSAQEISQGLPPDGDLNMGGDKQKLLQEKQKVEAYINALIQRTKQLLGETAYAAIFQTGLQAILADIKEDLAEFGVQFQQWFHESQLVKTGELQRGVEQLQQNGHLYERDGALWFKAVHFGDEKDRVVQRKTGEYTYFASDIAYHLNKYERGFDQIIDVFGADHHGYAPRIKAFLQALGKDPDKLIIPIVQFAVLFRGKEKVQMSTRGGNFVTLRELRQEVGNDAARFFYIMRKREQHLDFDLELAKSQSSDNPVYYIQYAHARICSVFSQLKPKQMIWDQEDGLQQLHRLIASHEKELLRCLVRYAEVLESAAFNYEPHLLAHYLQELANYFHTYYNAQQFLVEETALRNARLCLIAATKQVLANGLKLLGLSAPDTM